jgi:uncharacterized RDD family membrane protein YckC
MTDPSYQQPAYQPPGGSGPSGPRANFGQRLGAIIVDGIIIGVVFLVIYFINRVLAEIVAILLGLAYYTYFEGSGSGQTPGKKLLGIRVIDFKAGGSVGYGRAFVRQLGRILSGALCYLGYLWMLWDKEKQTWHDKIATTVVVPTSAYPVQSWPG